jgi:hypothetical protein
MRNAVMQAIIDQKVPCERTGEAETSFALFAVNPNSDVPSGISLKLRYEFNVAAEEQDARQLEPPFGSMVGRGLQGVNN